MIIKAKTSLLGRIVETFTWGRKTLKTESQKYSYLRLIAETIEKAEYDDSVDQITLTIQFDK